MVPVGIQNLTSCIGMEVQERAGVIEKVLKRNSKNNESSIASCLCYSIIALMTNKPKEVNFSFVFFVLNITLFLHVYL